MLKTGLMLSLPLFLCFIGNGVSTYIDLAIVHASNVVHANIYYVLSSTSPLNHQRLQPCLPTHLRISAIVEKWMSDYCRSNDVNSVTLKI